MKNAVVQGTGSIEGYKKLTKRQQALVVEYLDVIDKLVGKYNIPGYDREDFISLGKLALVKAVSKYSSDPELLRGYIYMAVKHALDELYNKEVLYRYGKGPFATKTKRFWGGASSLDAPVVQDGKEISMHDILPNDDTSIEDIVDTKATTDLLYDLVEKIASSPVRTAMKLYMQAPNEGYNPVAEAMGNSPAAVSRLIKEGMKRLRFNLKQMGYTGFEGGIVL